ncbi:hypothetical protein NDN08_000797 [Rhodosorus marinus]|uniref:Photosystem II reaction center Psb28 protein n=1 Tax=Rhodosorus marinus TaxID=101924 RepID=A0AAV8UPA1_9RHOD|nr:hypothetical protein NDN08_000797 [Rhodosorus marinus]
MAFVGLGGALRFEKARCEISSRSTCRSRPRYSRVVVSQTESADSEPTPKAKRLIEFFDEAKDLGTIRFINIGDGSVIETLGRFDYSVKYNMVRGGLLSLISPDSLFELHLATSKIDKITFTKQPAKFGDHDIYVIRVKRDDDGIMISGMLMWNPSEEPGTYFPGTVDKFVGLMEKYNGEIVFPSD